MKYPETDILTPVLQALDVLVLQRLGCDEFDVVGESPPWTQAVFGKNADPLSERSDFIANFLHEAEEYWKEPFPGGVESGIWCKTGLDRRDYFLEARALSVNGEAVLIVRSLGEEFEERATLVQRSHDQQLARRALLKDMEKKEILLNCIVHDLSNPLTALLINLERLQRFVTDDGREPLRTAIEVAHRQISLVQSISNLFAAEMADLGHFENTEANTSHAVDEAEAIVRTHLNAALDHTVSLRLDNDLPVGSERVFADSTHLQRVLENLVSNALRYAPEDSAVIVRARDDAKNSGFVRIEIDDEGSGVTESIADRVFNPFVRDHDTGGKAGLGLYFCKMTVTRWGGEIGYDSLPGGGTRFWFTMKRAA
ncbi:MAG: HAMP domain-containing sensor histidine kinase [Verrucomicrobiota bacterium]